MRPALAPLEGKYEIVAKLNEGGMGAIYKVRHRLLEEMRVVKVLRPQFENDADLVQRFSNEARAAIRLRHPNVIQIFDFLFEEGMGYIVMEYIEGVDLGQLVAGGHQASLPVSIEVARQGLRALGYLHQQGFLHRDISPDNLMLTLDFDDKPLVKMIDLGISKKIDSDQKLTASGMFLGKFRYCSPEHFGAKGPDGIEARSDLYSFGIVLYEFLTGRYPIRGDDHSQLIAGHLFHPPHPFEDTDPGERVPKALREVVLRALDKDPDRRFATAEAFSDALGALQAQFPMTESAHEEVRRLVEEHREARLAEGRSAEEAGSTQSRLDRGFGMAPTPPPVTATAPMADAPTVVTQTTATRTADTAASPDRTAQIDALLRGAETLHHLGHTEQARQQLAALLQIDSGNARARELLTAIDGEPPAVVTAPPAGPDPRQQAFEQHLETACSLAGDQHHADAILHFEAALEIQPDNDAVRQMLVEARLAAEEQRQAVRVRLQKEVGQLRELLAEGKLDVARERLLSARRAYGDDDLLNEVQAEIRDVEVTQRRVELLGRLNQAAEYRRAGELTEAMRLIEQVREQAGGGGDEEVAARITEEDTAIEEAHRLAAEVDEAIYRIEKLIDDGKLMEADRVLYQALEASSWDPRLAALRERLDATHHQERDGQVRGLIDQAAELVASDRLDEGRKMIQKVRVAAPDRMRAEVEERVAFLLEDIEKREKNVLLADVEKNVRKALDEQGPEKAQTVLEAAVVRHDGPDASRVFAGLREAIAEGYQDRVNALIKDAGLAFEEKRLRDAIRLLAEAVEIDPTDDWLRDRLRQARTALAAPTEPAIAVEKVTDLIEHGEKDAADYELRQAMAKWGKSDAFKELRKQIKKMD